MRFLILACFSVGIAAAATINYSDFTGAGATLQLNGDASIQGSALQLVPNADTKAGTAYENSAINFDANTAFSTEFKFHVTTNADDPTDGFAFLLQNDVVTAVGGAGQGNGFTGIEPSLAVIFRDRNPAFIGAVVNGVDTLPDGPDGATHFPEDQQSAFYNQDEYVWIDYDPSITTLSVYMSASDVKPGSAVLSTVVDAYSILSANGTLSPQAWVGFSAGNGGGFGTQDVLSWSFSSSEVPEPGTAGLYLLGLGIIAFGGKRLADR